MACPCLAHALGRNAGGRGAAIMITCISWPWKAFFMVEILPSITSSRKCLPLLDVSSSFRKLLLPCPNLTPNGNMVPWYPPAKKLKCHRSGQMWVNCGVGGRWRYGSERRWFLWVWKIGNDELKVVCMEDEKWVVRGSVGVTVERWGSGWWWALVGMKVD